MILKLKHSFPKVQNFWKTVNQCAKYLWYIPTNSGGGTYFTVCVPCAPLKQPRNLFEPAEAT